MDRWYYKAPNSIATLVIGLLGDSESELNPVVVSSCIFMDDERAETQADGLLEKIDSLKDRLLHLTEELKIDHPDKVDLIPSPDGIDISKLGGDGVIMTDTCNNTAQKIRRILVDKVGGAWDLDCMNHLRNVWVGNMEKDLSKV